MKYAVTMAELVGAALIAGALALGGTAQAEVKKEGAGTVGTGPKKDIDHAGAVWNGRVKPMLVKMKDDPDCETCEKAVQAEIDVIRRDLAKISCNPADKALVKYVEGYFFAKAKESPVKMILSVDANCRTYQLDVAMKVVEFPNSPAAQKALDWRTKGMNKIDAAMRAWDAKVEPAIKKLEQEPEPDANREAVRNEIRTFLDGMQLVECRPENPVLERFLKNAIELRAGKHTNAIKAFEVETACLGGREHFLTVRLRKLTFGLPL
jgi:hypothetical protein